MLPPPSRSHRRSSNSRLNLVIAPIFTISRAFLFSSVSRSPKIVSPSPVSGSSIPTENVQITEPLALEVSRRRDTGDPRAGGGTL